VETGQLIIGLLQQLSKSRYSAVKEVLYNYRTKTAVLYTEEGEVNLKDIEIISLSGHVGKESIIREDSFDIKAPASCYFEATKTGNELDLKGTCTS
jgi:hypothetical protein